VLQEVYRGLLVRNAGTCPWDPAKSSFGHYVHMVCGCVLSNYHRRQGRKKQHETAGYGDTMDESPDRTPQLTGRDATSDLAQYLERHLKLVDGKEAQVALRILPLVEAGYARGEIAERLGVTRAVVTKAFGYLKQAAGLWEKKGE